MTNLIKPRPPKHASSRPVSTVVRRVSIVCGSLLAYDAVSECALACLAAAAAQPAHVGPVEVRIYCLETDVLDSRIHVLKSSRDLLAEQFYHNSDFIIYHFGIFSEIHHSLAAAPRGAYVVIHFHGITPPQYLPGDWESLISNSFVQVGLFSTANEIVVGSAYLGEELKRMGITVPLRQIDLFGVNIAAEPAKKEQVSRPDNLNVIYCGRFVSSKQVVPLLDALESCVDEFKDLTLTLVGVRKHSDQLYLKSIEQRALDGRVNVVFALDLSSAEVINAIAAADMLALPSLHEGFGMPVAEGLANLTPIMCSDAGSLPEVAGGLGLLFKAADQQSLNTATRKALRARLEGKVLTDEGKLSYEDWAKRAQVFSSKYHRSEFVIRWQSLITEKLAERDPVGLPATAMTDGLNFLFQDETPHSPSEAQLLGQFVILKVLSRLNNNDVTGAINALHRWAFGRATDDASLDYWLRVYAEAETIDHLLAKMLSSAEVASSSLRVRSLAGLNSQLAKSSNSNSDFKKSLRALELPAMSRGEVEHVCQSVKNPEDFIRSLYLNVLRKTPDSEGLRYWVDVASNRDDWITVIDAFYGYVDEG